MIEKLLVAFDGSKTALAALDFALDLTGKYGTELFVPAVSRPPEFGVEEETEAVIEQSRRHDERVLHPLKARAGGLKARFEVRVGHRGHALFERWLIGSVARQVIAYAPCAMTVVRPRG
jgi:nucleotide-binding universal stress UspA family protein